MTMLQDVGSGFQQPVFASQAVFRRVLDAMAHPGRVVRLPTDAELPAGFDSATTAVALTLFDFETKVWLDRVARRPEAERYLRFHCGCPVVDETGDAAFAVITRPAEMLRLRAFSIGSDQYPDTSATLVIQVGALANGGPLTLVGPGIKDRITVDIKGLPAWFWEDWATNHACFPTGIDLILTCGEQAMCLPRSVKAEA